MFDMAEAPFIEKPVPKDSTDKAAIEARQRLQKVLDTHTAAAASAKGTKKQAKRDIKEQKKQQKRGTSRGVPEPAVVPAGSRENLPADE